MLSETSESLLNYVILDPLFAALTGVGDMLGVAVGHFAFSAIKSIFTGSDVRKEIPVATWLGAAAFCSGTIWQPAVNLFVGIHSLFYLNLL